MFVETPWYNNRMYSQPSFHELLADIILFLLSVFILATFWFVLLPTTLSPFSGRTIIIIEASNLNLETAITFLRTECFLFFLQRSPAHRVRMLCSKSISKLQRGRLALPAQHLELTEQRPMPKGKHNIHLSLRNKQNDR